MKHQNAFCKRLSAALLSLTVAASALSVSAAAFAVGEDNVLYETTRPLSDGLVYAQFVAEENGYTQEGYLFTYTGGLSTVPVVSFGEDIRGRESVLTVAGDAPLSDGHTVVGAANGDFFSMATGIPMGIMLRDGILYSSDANENAIGIKEDGSVLIGKPDVRVTLHKETATVSGSLTTAGSATETADTTPTVTVNHINKQPSVWGAYLLTPEYGDSTHAEEAGREIVFRLDKGAFAFDAPDEASTPTTDTAPEAPIDNTVYATVTAVRDSVTNGAIPDDGFVIVVHRDAQNASDFADLAAGDTVSLTLSCNDGWEDVTFAIGGGDILLSDGVAKTEDFSAEHANDRNPRTAIGYTADGTIRVFSVDGRTTASRGMTLAELAETMQSFGCVGALNLDGGGSTTVVIREENGKLAVENNPTDGYARRVGNAILFVNTASPDSAEHPVPYAAYLTPDAPIVFRDTPVTLTPVFVDQSYTAIPTPDAEITWSCDRGTVDEDGRYTPPTTDAGVAMVTAEIRIPLSAPIKTETGALVSEKVFCASATVYSVDALSGLTCSVAELTVPSGGISERIRVGGIWRGRDVRIDSRYIDAAFVRMTDGESTAIENPDDMRRTEWGYIDDTLSVHNTTSRKALEAASAVAGFPCSRLVLTVSDASSTHALYIPVTFGAVAEVVCDMEARDARSVFYIPDDGVGAFSRLTGGGRDGSAALVVSASGIAPIATPTASHPVKRIDLYLRGDLPANAHLRLSYDNTSRAILWKVTDDFSRLTEWKRISADLTEIRAEGLSDFEIEALFAAPSKFTVTLDDLIYHYGDDATVFVDISDSWAKDDILSVARMGVVGGIPQADGTYAFDPAGPLTRAAFAKMICVFAGLTVPEAPSPEELFPPVTEAEEPTEEDAVSDDTESAETTPPAETDTEADAPAEEPAPFVPYLPFADLADIPEWALPYIKAVTEAGYMRGKTTGETDEAGNPVTRFAANDTMTRAEVLQVLGTLIDAYREEPFGDNVTVFADDPQIPAWARANIGICVNAGIIAGFDDNTIRPAATITRAEIAALLVRTNGVLH